MKKKLYTLGFLVSTISLTGCFLDGKDASYVSIDMNDYDIESNPEYIAYWNDTIETESFEFRLKYQQWGIMAVEPGLHFYIKAKSEDITEYKVFSAEITDLEGNYVHEFISKPVEYIFNKRNNSHKECDFYYEYDDFIGQFNYYDFTSKNKYEMRIITEKANFVYHLWNKEKEGESTGKSKEDYDISNNQIYSADNTNRIRVDGEPNERIDNYRLFDIERCSGLWIGNLIILHVYDNNGDSKIEIIDFYLTDYEDGNKKVLLSAPLKFNFTSNLHIHLTDEDKTYYESLNNRVKVHIVTSEETLIFTIE